MMKISAFCLLFVAISVNATPIANFEDLAKKCAPSVAVDTLSAIVKTESSFNPFAIAVVGEKVTKQPETLQEAVFFVSKFVAKNKNFSVGLAQINSGNFEMLNLSAEELLDPCTNLKAASIILEKCYTRMKSDDSAKNLTDALSCYYSGNAKTGYEHGYVDRVIANAPTEIKIPSINQLLSKNNSSQAPKDEESLIISSTQQKRSALIF